MIPLEKKKKTKGTSFLAKNDTPGQKPNPKTSRFCFYSAPLWLGTDTPFFLTFVSNEKKFNLKKGDF